MPELIELTVFDKPQKYAFELLDYPNNGNPAIILKEWSDEHDCFMPDDMVISINTNYIFPGDSGEFVANHDVENWGVFPQLLEAGFVEDTGKRASYGFVQNARILRITDKAKEHTIDKMPATLTEDLEDFDIAMEAMDHYLPQFNWIALVDREEFATGKFAAIMHNMYEGAYEAWKDTAREFTKNATELVLYRRFCSIDDTQIPVLLLVYSPR